MNEEKNSVGLTRPTSFEKEDNLQGLNELKGSNEVKRSEASPKTHQADENHDDEVFGSVQDVEQGVFPESSRHFLPRNKDLEQKNREEEGRFQFGQTLNAELRRLGQEHRESLTRLMKITIMKFSEVFKMWSKKFFQKAVALDIGYHEIRM